jgi:hypothetical protein
MTKVWSRETVEDRERVLKMLSGDGYGGEANVRCPECGFDYSHVREVFTRFGTDPYGGGHPYPGTVAKGTSRYRRDALVIVFEGECGHLWELVIQQHKGINLLQLRHPVEVEAAPPQPLKF